MAKRYQGYVSERRLTREEHVKAVKNHSNLVASGFVHYAKRPPAAKGSGRKVIGANAEAYLPLYRVTRSVSPSAIPCSAQPGFSRDPST